MDNISELVRKQYINFPYPPIPVGAKEDEVLCSTNYEFVNYICTGEYKSHKGIKILDAGCGTGYSTLKLAQQNPSAEIMAIDFSSKSLEIAQERLEKAGLLSDRITFKEVNLLDTSSITDKFDYIVSTGVLHHLVEPETGLRNIRDLLRDEGIMYLMLYSEYGRHYLQLTRKLISLLQDNKEDLAEGLKLGRELFKTLADNNPLKAIHNLSYEAVSNSITTNLFEKDAQFIDAYVNVKERAYNLEQLFEFLENNQLFFLRFYEEHLYDPEIIFSKNSLLKEKAKKLSKKERYKLGEIVNSQSNFAFFTAKQDFQRKSFSNEELLKASIIISPVNIVKKEQNNIQVLNLLKTGLNFPEEVNFLYEIIFSSNQTILAVIEKIQRKLNFNYELCKNLALKFINVLEKENLIFIKFD